MRYTFARYEPIKVTFKKKLNLRDLTPEKEDKDLFWALMGAAARISNLLHL